MLVVLGLNAAYYSSRNAGLSSVFVPFSNIDPLPGRHTKVKQVVPHFKGNPLNISLYALASLGQLKFMPRLDFKFLKSVTLIFAPGTSLTPIPIMACISSHPLDHK